MAWQLEADNSIFVARCMVRYKRGFFDIPAWRHIQDQILALGAPSQQETCTWREHLTFLFFKLVQRYLLRGCEIQADYQEFQGKKKNKKGSCVLKSSLKATNSLNAIFMYYFNEKYLFNRATLHVYIEMEQQESFLYG